MGRWYVVVVASIGAVACGGRAISSNGSRSETDPTAGAQGRGGNFGSAGSRTASGASAGNADGGDDAPHAGGERAFAGQGGQSAAGGEAGSGIQGEAGAAGCQQGSGVIGDIRVPGDYSTIGDAIAAANAVATISVGPGTYYEQIAFQGKAIRLVSEAGPALTTIDGQQQGPVVTFESNEGRGAILEGFTIRNGSGFAGAGVTLFASSPTILHNVFVFNEQLAGGFGAAIGGNGASPLIDSNIFANNSCDDQSLSGVVTFVNRSSPQIVNNVLLNNPCPAINISVPIDAFPQVSNNSVVNNRTGVHVGATVDTSNHLYRNNLIIGGDVGLAVVFGTSSSLPNFRNNLVFGNSIDFFGVDDMTGTSGNVSFDPQLVDIQSVDMHLSPGSPAIDAGDGGPPALPPLDMEGHPRVLDGDGDALELIDIGADEVATTMACPSW